MTKLNYKTDITPIATRVGFKVSWRYYDNEKDARKEAKIAKHNAAIDAKLGYDFGFQMPGSVRPPQPGENVFHPDLWEVCCS